MHKFKKILIFFLFFIILVYGTFLRFHKIGEQSYWIDEGYTLNAVTSILEKGYPILDSNQNYDRSLLNTYLIAGAIKLGGFNPIATRSIAAIFGIGVIILIYLLGKRFFNQLIGLGAAFLTAFSYWEIAWSRQARMYIQLQFFFLFSLYLFNSLLTRFSYKKLIFLILTTIAAILSHFFGYFLLAIYLIIFLVKLVEIKKEEIKLFLKQKRNIITSALLLLIFMVAVIRLTRQLFNLLSSNQSYLGLNYQQFLLDYLPLIAILALLGMIVAVIKEKKTLPSLLLVIAYFIPYLIIIFSVNTQHFRYLFFILPILFIFSVYLLFSISQKFKKYPSLIFSLLFIILIVSSSLINDRTLTFIPRNNYYLEPFTPQPNFALAYNIIKQAGWDEDKVIISPFTQMDKIYLGKSDYWLAIGLDGRQLDKNQLPEREYYNNAVTISSAEQLEEVMGTKTGYIVVDDMASVRLSAKINQLINQQKLIFNDLKKIGNRIWVFSF